MSKINLSGFKKAKAITLPLFKWQNDVERYYRFESEMFTGKAVKKAGAGKEMDPATIANVTDLETGEQGQIIMGAVLQGIIRDDILANGGEYVGKCFAITQHRIPEHKYNTYTVIEIEADEAPQGDASDTSGATGKAKGKGKS